MDKIFKSSNCSFTLFKNVEINGQRMFETTTYKQWVNFKFDFQQQTNNSRKLIAQGIWSKMFPKLYCMSMLRQINNTKELFLLGLSLGK